MPLPAIIDAEAYRDCVRCEAHIELAGFPLGRRGNGKLQVHVRFVKRLVLRKTDVSVDPRKIRPRTAGGVEARIELQYRWRKFFQQATKLLNQNSLIALPVIFHPLLLVLSPPTL